MYSVTPNFRLAKEIYPVLKNHFGDKAEVGIHGRDAIIINVLSGYEQETTHLTEQQIKDNVCGGGVIMTMNGCYFELTIKEIKWQTK